ncbi:MAG: amidohydrolase, partial [Actinomycetota bacterium]
AGRGGGILFGGNFEDPLDRPLLAADLDAVVGDRPALLARADMHSCIVSSALLRAFDLDDLEGVERDAGGRPTGYLREQGARSAWVWFDAHLAPDQQRDALLAAVRIACSKGVSSVHEMYVVEWRGWDSLAVVTETLQHAALNVVLYVATPEVERIQEMGLTRIGGDLFLDGAFGSHTAWLEEPYESTPPSGVPGCGISYRSDEELHSFFLRAQRAGLQVGVHAIGDAAIDQALRGWEKVAAEAGEGAVRALGHRLEHFECASDEHISRAALLGLRISVQPAFDRLWGGAHGMYARRIGHRRARAMNRFRTMAGAGLVVGAGSDSTVTPLDPFLQMAALREHHVEGERLGPLEALRMHTLGSHALAGGDGARGSIEAGKHADLALLDRDPLEVDTGALLATEVIGTWIEGRRVWPASEAEADPATGGGRG